MIKHIILILSSSLLIFSCNLINPEDETPLPKDPEVEFILNDSLVGSFSEVMLTYPSGSVTFDRALNMKMDAENIYIGDYDNGGIGVIKKFNLNGEFVDSLENVLAFYLSDNFIYVFQDDSISKYNNDFSYISTIFKDINIYPGEYSDGDENGCLSTNINSAPLSLYNYARSSIEAIGAHQSGADKPLEFQNLNLTIKKDGQLYYVYDFQTDRIQLLNLDGSYKSDLVYDPLKVVGNYGDLIEMSFNDTNIFLANNDFDDARVQMFKKSDFSYIGFIENKEFKKTFISATNDKLYIVSLYPTPKIVIYDLL